MELRRRVESHRPDFTGDRAGGLRPGQTLPDHGGAGDQDELGTVVYVYVGVSKTTGKLIAIMTQAVYT